MAEPFKTDLIRTQRIEIVNNEGRTRGVFGMLPNDNVGFGFLGVDGKLQAQLIIQQGLGTAFVLSDKQGRARIQVALGEDEVAGVTLFYLNGRPHITLAMGPDETGTLLFASADEKLMWSAP